MTDEQQGQAIVPAAEERQQDIEVGERGVVIHTLGQMWRFAKMVAASGLAPKGLERPEAIVIALQLGAEIGLSPMAALQSVAVINGRPSVYGDAALAVARASGRFDEAAFDERVDVPTTGDIMATCTVRRLPDGKPITRTWSLSQARRAGLLAKSGPWSQYPERMCQMRARSVALRDGFADVLRGFPIREEVGADLRSTLEAEAVPEATTTASTPLVAAISAHTSSTAGPMTPAVIRGRRGRRPKPVDVRDVLAAEDAARAEAEDRAFDRKLAGMPSSEAARRADEEQAFVAAKLGEPASDADDSMFVDHANDGENE